MRSAPLGLCLLCLRCLLCFPSVPWVLLHPLFHRLPWVLSPLSVLSPPALRLPHIQEVRWARIQLARTVHGVRERLCFQLRRLDPSVLSVHSVPPRPSLRWDLSGESPRPLVPSRSRQSDRLHP